MKPAPATELPDELEPSMRRGRVLAFAMIGYLVVDAVVLYLLMGGSQSATALIVEDALELVPPILFLTAARIRDRPASARYPYGFHRVATLGFFGSALALLAFGLVILGLAAWSLFRLDRPTIGSLEVFGTVVWRGWLVLGWLVLGVTIPIVLGRMMRGPARRINNNILHATGRMLSADWQSTAAAFVGVLGVAIGLWWADAGAAALIAFGVIVDGVRNTRQAAAELVDRMPTRLGSNETVGVVTDIERLVERCGWIDDAEVRLREHGQVYFGEVIAEVGDRRVDPRLLRELNEEVTDLDWRLQEVLIVPVMSVDGNVRPLDSSGRTK